MDSELTQQILNLKDGDHLCLIYDKYPAEQMPAVLPFIKEGLARQERCIYIADDQTTEEVVQALEAGGIDVEHELDRGALRLWTRREWRLPGKLHSQKKAQQVRGIIDATLGAGFKGIRFAVEMTWTLGPEVDFEELRHWEAMLNTIFVPGFPGRIICQYNRARLPPAVIQAALETHPTAILGSRVCPNLFYEAPLILEERSETDRLDWRLAQLTEAHAAQQEREDLIRKESSDLRRQSVRAPGKAQREDALQ